MTDIHIRLGALGNANSADDQLTVTLHAGGGDDPGDLICNLQQRSVIRANSTARYISRGLCSTLEPNTTYFIVVERHTVDADTVEVSVTASDNEDAARPGWSIADDSRVYDGTNWSSGGGSSLAIDVRAVDIPSEEDLRPTSTVEQLVPGPVGKLVGNNLGDLPSVFILETELDRIAQAFTTGANSDGYRLDSLGWLAYNIVNVASFNDGVNVSLRTSNGRNPDEALCTLGGAQAFTIGGERMVRFYPPSATACPALEPNTTYFGVLEDVPGDGITAWVTNTDTGAEDEDSAPGWSIGDKTHQDPAGGDTQWATSSDDETAWAFEVRGAELAPPPSVKNFGQTLSSLSQLNTAGTKISQAFTTGEHERGYELSSLGVDIYDWTDASHLAVTLNADNNGVPGEALCTLSKPASLSRPQTLDAPITCPRLTSKTTYFAVIEVLVELSFEQEVSVAFTASGDEDSDSAPDWSIADDSVGFNGSVWNKLHTTRMGMVTDNIYYIEVKAVPVQASLRTPSTPVVFSYTVEATDESGPDGVAVGDPDSAGNAIELNGGEITIRRSGEAFPLDYRALFADAGHLVNLGASDAGLGGDV